MQCIDVCIRLKIILILNVMPCSLVDLYRRFGGICSQTAQHHVKEVSNHHTDRPVNLKFRSKNPVFTELPKFMHARTIHSCVKFTLFDVLF
jgi:hypothetical protein